MINHLVTKLYSSGNCKIVLCRELYLYEVDNTLAYLKALCNRAVKRFMCKKRLGPYSQHFIFFVTYE
jgi:hypothetical protein